MLPPDSVQVRVPGSTSNLGPGFDCLGLALQIYNTVAIRRISGSTDGPRLTLHGEAPPRFFQGAVQAFFEETSSTWKDRFDLSIDCEVPRSRGLGSSAALRVGILAGINFLTGNFMAREQIAALATRLEGHPDNAAASVHGGFCVSRTAPDGTLIDVQRFAVADRLFFVTVSPDVELETSDSRRMLPESVSLRAAARNINSVATLVGAFATQRYELLRTAIEDHLHQPSRLPAIPGARQSIEAGMAAGALTGFLSGSGSSVICIAHDLTCAERVSVEMRSAFSASGITSEARVLRADNDGYVIVDRT